MICTALRALPHLPFGYVDSVLHTLICYYVAHTFVACVELPFTLLLVTAHRRAGLDGYDFTSVLLSGHHIYYRSTSTYVTLHHTSHVVHLR